MLSHELDKCTYAKIIIVSIFKSKLKEPLWNHKAHAVPVDSSVINHCDVQILQNIAELYKFHEKSNFQLSSNKILFTKCYKCSK